MKFRQHRGTLRASMATMVYIEPTRAALVGHLERLEAFDSINVAKAIITVKPHKFDPRVGWDTHFVFLNGEMVGMTDGPLEGAR